MSSLRRKILNLYQKKKYFNIVLNILSPIIPVRYLYGDKFYQLQNFIKQTEFFSTNEHRKVIRKKLTLVFQNAFENIEYYKNIFERIGIKTLNDFYHIDSFDLIKSLPIIDKSVVKENFKLFISKNKRILKDYISTGGTSGEPFYFYINSERSSIEWSFMVDLWSRIGFNLNSKRASFRGNKIRDLYVDDPILKEKRFSSFRLSDTYLAEIWSYLLSYNPDFLYAYPSAAYIIAKFVKNNNSQLPKSLKGILIGSENIYENQRNFIENVFGVKTFAWYGHSEKLVLAGECEYERIYHAYPQYGFVEFINQNNEPAKPGEFAEIVGTGFINTVMPFIRYRTGDWCIYLGDHCPNCKRNYQIFKEVQGRWTQEMLIGRDSNLISMSAINVHSKEFERVSRFQYYQEKPGKATLKLVPAKGFSKSDEDKIHQTIQEKLKDTIMLETQIVNDLPNTVSGKFKFIDQRLNVDDFKQNFS